MSNPEERGEAPHPSADKPPVRKEVTGDELKIKADFTVNLRNPWNLPTEIENHFDRHTWWATEACLAAHATLLIEGAECFGLLITGPSGTGKTTILEFFKGARDLYRVDDLTSASFVSHDASKDPDDLKDIDLLPKIKHKSLVAHDMATWFSGPRDQVREEMAKLASVMDGNGLTRATGTHGTRGYSGDYRFNVLGATTPLQPRAWRAMGHTGNRFVFHELPPRPENTKDAVFGDIEHTDRRDAINALVSEYLRDLWDETGGYDSLTWETTPTEDVQDAIVYLGRLVAHGRAPVSNGEPQIEGQNRVTTSLRNLARGRALLDGRMMVTQSDLPVVARVALSTMHQKRRRLVRHLLNPAMDDTLSTSDVQSHLGVSGKTAKARMERLDTLRFGTFTEGSGSESHRLTLSDTFRWPKNIPFPEL